MQKEKISSIISEMSIEEKIGQCLVIGFRRGQLLLPKYIAE